MTPYQERFWSRVDKEGENGCWVWTAARTSRGYGNFAIKKKNYVAHRLSYEWMVGEIGEGLHVDHLCRNRACVNPAHLEPVTHRENLLRGETIPAEHAKKTHCPAGHAYDKKNTYICKSGSRHCRTCRNKRGNQYYHNVIKKRAVNE